MTEYFGDFAYADVQDLPIGWDGEEVVYSPTSIVLTVKGEDGVSNIVVRDWFAVRANADEGWLDVYEDAKVSDKIVRKHGNFAIWRKETEIPNLAELQNLTG